MDNRDYNEPNRDYCAPEEESNWNDRPVYETAEEYNEAHRTETESQNGYTQGEQYAYQQYQQNANNPYGNSGAYGNNGYYGSNGYYGNGYYNSGRYNNMGGVVVDSVTGKEIKNRFGLKLTLSIIEMLCCCLGGCASLIAGIVGCVFTCQANNAYQQGRYDEFKSKNTGSTIALSIGGGLLALSLIVNAITYGYIFTSDEFWDAFMEGYESGLEGDFDFDDFEGDFDVDSNYKEDAEHENFEDFNEVVVGDVVMAVPCSYSELEKLGFFINASDLNDVIDAGNDGYYEIHADGVDNVGNVWVANYGEESMSAAECTIVSIEFYYYGSDEEKELFSNIEFVNGLTVFQTPEEALELIGEPNYYYTSDSGYGMSGAYQWEFEYSENPYDYYSYVSITLCEDAICGIEISNEPW